MKRRFEQWYSDEVTKQLEAVEDVETVEVQPVDMCSLTARWLVEMGEYVSENPQILVNGFRHAGMLASWRMHSRAIQCKQAACTPILRKSGNGRQRNMCACLTGIPQL